MSKLPRDHRQTMMLSEQELREIDDWRYENRIATRSEAIRRLCKTGLLREDDLDAIKRRAFIDAINSLSAAEAELDEADSTGAVQH